MKGTDRDKSNLNLFFKIDTYMVPYTLMQGSKYVHGKRPNALDLAILVG